MIAPLVPSDEWNVITLPLVETVVTVGGKHPYIVGTQGGFTLPLTVAPLTVIVPISDPPQSTNVIVLPVACTCQTAMFEVNVPENVALDALTEPFIGVVAPSISINECPEPVTVLRNVVPLTPHAPLKAGRHEAQLPPRHVIDVPQTVPSVPRVHVVVSASIVVFVAQLPPEHSGLVHVRWRVAVVEHVPAHSHAPQAPQPPVPQLVPSVVRVHAME